MDNGPRKASDIILSLEQKIEQLIKANNSLDLNVKILSNKLNKVLEVLSSVNVAPLSDAAVPLIHTSTFASNTSHVSLPQEETFQEYHNDNQPILVQKAESVPLSDEPIGHRRTSRLDTIMAKKSAPPPTINAPIPASVEVPQTASNTNGRIAVQQRVVDKNGKAMFMADVEIINLDTRQVAFKGRTSGVGKWTTPLDVGNYKVFIRKQENSTKEKIEVSQHLIVDGAKSPLELPIVIAK